MNRFVENNALVWSYEDLDINVIKLFHSNQISLDVYKKYQSLSEDERHNILSDIIEDVEDHIMEYMNDLIADQFYYRVEDGNLTDIKWNNLNV